MEKEPLFTNQMLKKLIVPLVIEQILAITVGMADTVMVSAAGEAAISGVSLVDMINNTDGPLELKDCLVGGISVSSYDVEDGGLTVIFPG